MITHMIFICKIFWCCRNDGILVGDSASNVMAGMNNFTHYAGPIIYHASSVIRGVDRSLVVVDLPFGSYQSNSKEALASAIRIMKETGAHAVKLEGGEEVLESINRIVAAGVPVMGHLGLTPQSIYKFGTYTVRAKEEAEAAKLRDAKFYRTQLLAVCWKKSATLAKEFSESLLCQLLARFRNLATDVLVSMICLVNTELTAFFTTIFNLHPEITAAYNSISKMWSRTTFQ